ncbi:MAG: exonuclease domain-containing protein [Solirubrobacteraceae bacterium]
MTVLLDTPLREAEFLAVDTETNGRGGERCELTEVGAVLAGGGELHDRWCSLVRTHAPLGHGIQRFTGITQAMVDAAPAGEEVLPALAARLEGRVLVAHNAAFDVRVLGQAFARAGLQWPDPPVICTIALARRMLPLQRRRGLREVASALGIEVAAAHRALADAETCGRVLCALLPRLCAQASTVGDGLDALRPRRRPRRAPRERSGSAVARARARLSQIDLGELPSDPGVYIFRDAAGRALYVGKSVSIRSRARAHFAPSLGGAEWTGQAAVADYRSTASELGALLLECRLIRELRPPGNKRLRGPDGRLVYLRCRLEDPFPALEVAPEPASGHGWSAGPVRGRAAAIELMEQVDSLFGLRHCGRTLKPRAGPSAYGQMGRCLSPCLGDLDPNLYRRRLDAALGLFASRRGGGEALLDHVAAQMRRAAETRRYERAEALRRRRARLEVVLGRLEGVLRATHAAPELVLARHPLADRHDAVWLAGGRVAAWEPLSTSSRLVERTEAVLSDRARSGIGAWVPAEEVPEIRTAAAWLQAHPDTPRLALDPSPTPREVERFAAAARRSRSVGHALAGGGPAR